MRILITGGCGFLGSHLVEHFLKNTEADLVILDKLTYASLGFDRLRHVRDGLVATGIMTADDWARRILMLTSDLASVGEVGVIREVGEIDFIIHAAAESHVDRSITDPMPFLQSNVIGTHNLLWAARDIPSLKRIFMVSTDEVYGPSVFMDHKTELAMQNSDNYDALYGFAEDARFRPANPYAAAKAGGEMVAMAYANTYKLPVTIVNTMNLIGERQHPEKFVPMVIRKVMAGETVTIHADQTRTKSGTRFYLHCRTFAHALLWMVSHWTGGGTQPCGKKLWGFQDGEFPLKLHVCGEREISNLELAEMIARCVGKPLQHEMVDFHSSRPGHDLRYAMDDSAIRGLGWARPMGLEASLEKTVHWYLANPQWLAPNKPG